MNILSQAVHTLLSCFLLSTSNNIVVFTPRITPYIYDLRMISAIGALRPLTSNYDDPTQWRRQHYYPPFGNTTLESENAIKTSDEHIPKRPRYKAAKELMFFNHNLRDDTSENQYATHSQGACVPPQIAIKNAATTATTKENMSKTCVSTEDSLGLHIKQGNQNTVLTQLPTVMAISSSCASFTPEITCPPIPEDEEDEPCRYVHRPQIFNRTRGNPKTIHDCI